MKNLLFFFAACFMLVSCSDDDDNNGGNGEPSVQIDDLVGEWVYNHPEEGIWEVQKFMPSGVFYYSDKVTGSWKFENTMNSGRYWVEDNNRVTCQFSINGVSTQIKMTVLEITPYSYTAEYNDGAQLGTFTYARLLSKVQIKPGKSVTPDYSALLTVTANSFKSHNTNIATVDSHGTITGLKSGHTYIDVDTPQGTAVIEVVIFDNENMFADYSFAFGKTIPEIVGIIGNGYVYRDDNAGLVYELDDYLADELSFMTGLYDTKHVEFVQLKLNGNVSVSSIVAHLTDKYTLLSSSEGVYNIITDLTVDGSPIVAIYDSNNSKITFSTILPESRWTDFAYLFGQSDAIVHQEMTECGYPYLFSDYSYSKDGSDYYTINDSKDASMVGFVFNGENKMCEYWIYLYDDYMEYAEDIVTWLKSRYVLSTEETTSTQYVFYDNLNRMRVVFDASGYVSYTDTAQTPFTPASGTMSMSSPDMEKIQPLKLSRTAKEVSPAFNLRIPVLNRR